MRIWSVWLLIVFGAALVAACGDTGGNSSSGLTRLERSRAPVASDEQTLDGCDGSERRVCLVPVEDFDEPSVESLVEHLRGLGIPAGATEPVSLRVSDIDAARSQLSANRVEERVANAYPDLATDPNVTLIALTDRDIFIEELTFRWVFGMRGPDSHVISTARMYEEFWDGPRDDALRDSRLRKMLLRYVGLFHLDLPENDSPLTVLYEHLDGLQSLDAMREGILEPSELPRPSSDLEAWAHAFCAGAERLAVADYDADNEFERRFDLEGPADPNRTVALRYASALRINRAQYADTVAEARRWAERTERPELVHLGQANEASVEATMQALSEALLDLEGLATTPQIYARLVEVYVSTWTDPAGIALYEAYESLPLDAAVAIADAGPCGPYAPAAFYTQPLI